MLRRILVGYDGSAQAERALEFAIDIASQSEGSEIHIGYVVQKPGGVPDPVPVEVIDSLRKTGCQTLANAERLARKSHLVSAIHLEVGNPGEELLSLAGRLKPDLVVLGTLQHLPSEKLLGTVSSYFLKSRKFPLLIVP